MLSLSGTAPDRIVVIVRKPTLVVLAVLHVGVAVTSRAADVAELSAVGPPLTALHTKIADPNWLLAWLLKPSKLRPGTSMPDADLTADEAQAVVRYLYGKPPKADPPPPGDAQVGAQLFVSRGCRGCHATEPNERSISNRVPNLAGIGLKVRADWLAKWLKAPRAYNPHTAMPQLALSDEDIRHLVAYLLSRRAGMEAVAAAPRFDPKVDAAAGRAVIERYECAKCHVVSGFAPPAPAFTLAEETTTDVAVRNGRLLVAYYNCRGCHQIDGSGGAIAQHLERKTLAPPTLEGEGARVQSSWLVQFLQQPVSLRPWLQMRMPQFGLSAAEATALAHYFATLARVPPSDEPLPAAAEELTTRGLRRLAHYKCVQCHPTSVDARATAGTDADNLSINLTLAKQRLRPSWIRGFLAKPKAIAGAQTRMPAIFYTSDGNPKVDDPDADIEAIAAYILHLTESPESALAKLDAARQGERRSPPTDWSKVEY